MDISAYQKVDEIPYDFARKRLGVVVCDAAGHHVLINKGALESILAVCRQVQDGAERAPLDTTWRDQIEQGAAAWSDQGLRVLGLATKPVAPQASYSRADEHDLIF